MAKLTKDEELYLKAQKAYDEGQPIMGDDAFDTLKDKLTNQGSKVVNLIGTMFASGEKVKHVTPMLSLAKVKAKTNTEPPTEEFFKWAKKTRTKKYIIEPKYDGNACNVIYKNGVLEKAVTRGDGAEGFDITHAIKHLVPNKLKRALDVEIRGEVIIKKNVFNQKYAADYQNPRNLVAGVLHRLDVEKSVLSDLNFVSFEVKNQLMDSYELLKENKFATGFSKSVVIENKAQFEAIFYEMLDFRDNKSEFVLDGYVVKVEDIFTRNLLGENGHHPEWALAVKFEPKGTIATIKRIEWNLSKRNELIPIGILEPVELDGTTVTRVSLYNYNFVISNFENGIVGAQVELVKFGDIIPGIINVISDGENSNWKPTECPVCGGQIKTTDVHLICTNPECTGGALKTFVYGVKQLGIDLLGDKTIESFFEIGFRNPLDLLDKTKFNKTLLVSKGVKDTKNLDKIFENISKIKEISLEQILLTLGIPNLGNTVSKQLALWYTGKAHSFKGLEKAVVHTIVEGEGNKKFNIAIHNINLLGLTISNFKVEEIKKTNSNKLHFTIEMTGSTKDFGFKTKEEFVHELEKFANITHDKLTKDSDYLVTDRYDSSSSKMAKAEKYHVAIIRYDDLLKKLKQGN